MLARVSAIFQEYFPSLNGAFNVASGGSKPLLFNVALSEFVPSEGGASAPPFLRSVGLQAEASGLATSYGSLK